MTDKNIGLLVAKLNREIQEGVELFNDYKELSKEFQEQQKNLTTKFRDQKKEIDEINKRRAGIAKRKLNKALTIEQIKLANLLNQELKEKQNEIKNLDKKSEDTFVKINKKFLKEKKKINDKKKKILKKILDIGKEIRSKMDNIEEFKKFVDRIQKRKYEVFNGKTITFDTLMHHLQSGEISNEVSKTTKQIDELMTIGNIVNRKKKMEIGILEKEIKNLLIDYDTTMSSLKKFVAFKYPNKKNITNEDVESLLKTKYSKENSPEFRQKIYNLASKLKKYNYEVKTKMRKLQKLKASS
jgi:hypothetical protein